MFIAVLFIAVQTGKNPNVHQLVKGQRNCGISIQWNTFLNKKKQSTCMLINIDGSMKN